MPLIPLDRFSVLADGLDHPECVTLGPDGRVYAGGEAGQVYRVSGSGEVSQVGSTGGFLLGLCLDRAGAVYCCDTVHGAVMRMAPDGQVRRYSDLPMVNPNYPVFDRAGNLYVSDSGKWEADDGRLLVVRPGGGTEVLDTAATAFPNGLALSAGEDWLYVALSTSPSVVRLPVYEGRPTGPLEHLVDLPGTVPDGLALDAAGNLYVSCYAPDRIYRLTPDGGLEVVAEDWQRVTLASPTNLTFAGPELTTLVVASLGRWHLAQTTVDIPGQPYSYPVLPG